MHAPRHGCTVPCGSPRAITPVLVHGLVFVDVLLSAVMHVLSPVVIGNHGETSDLVGGV